jgi:hypothetical protein
MVKIMKREFYLERTLSRPGCLKYTATGGGCSLTQGVLAKESKISKLMKTTQKTLPDSVTFALLLIAATQVSAQSYIQRDVPELPPVKIALALNATMPGRSFFQTDTIFASTTRWTSQLLLTIAENKYGVKFPAGASLAQWGTNIVVVDTTGMNVITNLSADGLAHLTFSDIRIIRGQSNFDTGAQAISQNYTFKFSVNDGNGTSFNLTGVGREKYSRSAVNEHGEQKITYTVSSTLIGDGLIGRLPAVISGSALTRGTGTVSVQ